MEIKAVFGALIRKTPSSLAAHAISDQCKIQRI